MSDSRDHNCEDHLVCNCDGTHHFRFCSVCDRDLGTEDCPLQGSWPSEEEPYGEDPFEELSEEE
jgi:hypothetical protein